MNKIFHSRKDKEMKNVVKRSITTVMAILMLFVSCTPLVTSASSAIDDDMGISPCFSNCVECSYSFSAVQGAAHVEASYVALGEVFTYAKMTVKIQKRFLGVFWNTVDIGETNNEWVAYSYDVLGDFYNSFPLDSTGTYRAVITIEFYGTTGVVDVIEDTIESVYE